MAGTGLNLKNTIEIKRLWKLGIKSRQIAKILGVHRNTVNKYVEQFRNEDGDQKPKISEEKIKVKTSSDAIQVDWEKVRSEYLGGVPLNIIHEELLETNRINIGYSGFWKQAKKKISLTEATMVRIFKPGDRTEIDYADGIDILDPAAGEIRKTEFFVGVLWHSRYAFAEFTWTQSSADFLESHVNMFEFFGGTTQVLSPDNLKSAVTKAHRYDPVINQAYTRLASHYEIAVVPARVRTPKDKAIVELNQCLREHCSLITKQSVKEALV